MAIALQKQGVDFVILEKADDVGGTWRDNSYPGCACDIPSHLYSYSFEPKPDWKNPFSYQPEIWDYLKGITEKYGLRRYIEFNSLVDRGYWDDDEYRWHVFTTDGREYVAQFLVSGAGALHVPSFPEIDGRDEFAGPAFHSAEWDHSVDLTGKRVAIIGTGASAIQIVPEIVGQVAELQLYQRTPPWVVPRTNPELPLRAAPGHGECPRAARADAPRHLLGPGGAGLRHDQAAGRAEGHRGATQSTTSAARSRTASCAAN